MLLEDIVWIVSLWLEEYFKGLDFMIKMVIFKDLVTFASFIL